MADSGEEWQLCFPAARLPSELVEGALLRFTGTEEQQRTRRGLRAFQCDRLLELLLPPVDQCLPCGPAPSETAEPAALCKYFVRYGGSLPGCRAPGCTYRHAFANKHEEETVCAARERWAAPRRAYEDTEDPFLGEGGGGGRGPGKNPAKNVHAQRHAEFAMWLLRTYGADALQVRPVLGLWGPRLGPWLWLGLARLPANTTYFSYH